MKLFLVLDANGYLSIFLPIIVIQNMLGYLFNCDQQERMKQSF